MGPAIKSTEELQNPITEKELQTAYNKHLLWFQDQLLRQPQVDLPTFHDFAPGVYMRTMFAKKGSVVIGKTHKTEHFNVCLTGAARVMINGELKLIQAPTVFVSKAGTKKLFKVLEDMVYFTIHPTTETDVDVIEDLFTYSLDDEKLLLEGDL